MSSDHSLSSDGVSTTTVPDKRYDARTPRFVPTPVILYCTLAYPGPGLRTAACRTSDSSVAPPPLLPLFFHWPEMLQMTVLVHVWRRIFDPHILQQCMDSIMPESFGKKPIRGINLSISRHHLIISPVAARRDLCHDF
jgi:hypothetical protein